MTETAHILITGATGKTGRRVSALLRDQGYAVREGSRSSATPFDWTDPSTWPAALDAITAVYIVTPDVTDPAVAGRLRDFGTAAVGAGVSRAISPSAHPQRLHGIEPRGPPGREDGGQEGQGDRDRRHGHQWPMPGVDEYRVDECVGDVAVGGSLVESHL